MAVNKEQLIEAVKGFPCLYDTSRKEYKDELLRENAWTVICADLYEKAYEDKDERVNGKEKFIVYNWMKCLES